jgi:hypothetical protein
MLAYMPAYMSVQMVHESYALLTQESSARPQEAAGKDGGATAAQPPPTAATTACRVRVRRDLAVLLAESAVDETTEEARTSQSPSPLVGRVFRRRARSTPAPRVPARTPPVVGLLYRRSTASLITVNAT